MGKGSMSWDPSRTSFKGPAVLLKGVPGISGRQERKQDVCPPCLQQGLQVALTWWKDFFEKWETSGGTNSGWPLTGYQTHSCSLPGPLPWSRGQPLALDPVCRRTLETRVWSPWGLGSATEQAQGRPRARCWQSSLRRVGKLSSSALKAIHTCCPGWLWSKGQFGRQVSWIACHVYMTQSTLLSFGCVLQSHLS